jgi:hypothetical protein
LREEFKKDESVPKKINLSKIFSPENKQKTKDFK